MTFASKYQNPNTAAWLSAIFLFVGLIPVIINYTSFYPAWDDTYFMHRAVCVSSAVTHRSLSQVQSCLSILSKSPLMVTLAIPWGAIGRSIEGLGLMFVSLAIMTWLLAAACMAILMRLRVSPLAVLLLALALGLNKQLSEISGSLLVDTLFSFVVALSFLLLPLERDVPVSGPTDERMRGVLWGLVILLGVSSKVTYLFFVPFIAAGLFYYRHKATGARSFFISTAIALVVASPAIILFVVFWHNFIGHAIDASFGSISKFYASNRAGPLAYFQSFLLALGAAWPAWFVLAIWAAFSAKIRTLSLIDIAILFLPLAGFFGTLLLSSNADIRFAMPVMVAAPFLLTALLQRRPSAEYSTQPIPIFILLGVVLSLPMFARADLKYVRAAQEVLGILPSSKPVSLIIGTDGPRFNVETLLLAQQVEGGVKNNISIDTLVYDYIHDHPLSYSLDRLAKSDYAVFQNPPLATDPEWANKFATDFRSKVLEKGKLIGPDSNKLVDIYKLSSVEQ